MKVTKIWAGVRQKQARMDGLVQFRKNVRGVDGYMIVMAQIVIGYQILPNCKLFQAWCLQHLHPEYLGLKMTLTCKVEAQSSSATYTNAEASLVQIHSGSAEDRLHVRQRLPPIARTGASHGSFSHSGKEDLLAGIQPFASLESPEFHKRPKGDQSSGWWLTLGQYCSAERLLLSTQAFSGASALRNISSLSTFCLMIW